MTLPSHSPTPTSRNMSIAPDQNIYKEYMYIYNNHVNSCFASAEIKGMQRETAMKYYLLIIFAKLKKIFIVRFSLVNGHLYTVSGDIN